MTLTFAKAQRTAVKLKILVTGPSGSGKTFGALKLADGIAPGKIAVLDSENDRASYYADQVDFDVLRLPNAEPRTYMAGLKAAVEAGYQVVMIDSLSHAWQDVLDRKTEFDRANPKSNGFMNWKLFGGEWDAFIREILDAPVHVIATARSKQAFEQTEVDGKKKVLKLGLAPQIREGTDFEFALHFDLNEQHRAEVRKDNTLLFGDDRTVWDLANGVIAKMLLGWLSTAKPAPRVAPAAVVAPARPVPENGSTKQREFYGKLLRSSVWTAEDRDAYDVRFAEADAGQLVALLDEILEEGKARKAAIKEEATP